MLYSASLPSGKSHCSATECTPLIFVKFKYVHLKFMVYGRKQVYMYIASSPNSPWGGGGLGMRLTQLHTHFRNAVTLLRGLLRLVLRSPTTVPSILSNLEHSRQAYSSAGITPMEPNYTLVGDNWENNVQPWLMTMECPTTSLHLFHAYAALDRIDCAKLTVGSPCHHCLGYIIMT